MNLRPSRQSSRPPARRLVLLAGLALGLLLLGRPPNDAAAGLSDYSATLYLSSTASTPLPSGSFKLVTAAGPGQPTGPLTLALGGVGLLSAASYSYAYTLVDPTGGETAVNTPVAPTITGALGKTVVVSGLPTGVTVRLYRKGTAAPNDVFRRLATLTNNGSATYTDNTDDATAGAQPILPQAQNRPVLVGGFAALGYYEFAPGVALTSSTATNTALPGGPAFSGKGWLVDGGGRVSFPSGTWTFTTKLKGEAGNGTARLVIGMWKVNDSGAVVGSPIIDPTGAGENTTANIATAAGTASAIVTTINGVAAISVAVDEHLYVQFWRRQTVGSSGTPRTTLFAYDGVARIAHPTANGFPSVPATGSVAARVNTLQLSATFSDPDVSDTGTLSFELCGDSACNTLLQPGSSGSSSSGVANGASGSWTPSITPVNGTTYYWRAGAQDSAGNLSGWSAPGSFSVDNTSPSVPAPGTVAERVNAAPQLSATLSDPDTNADTGSLSFQLCSDSACSTVLQSGTSSVVANGASGGWTPGALADGLYYWRARAQDVATNTSAWSATRTFTVDTVVPTAPALTAPADGAWFTSLPSLASTFAAADSGDTGTLSFQVCSDAACATVIASGSSGTLTNGGSASWHPSALADGSYYARVRAQDAAGNMSAWSPALSFRLDATAPDVPVRDGIVAGTRTAHVPTLGATFSDPGGAGAGTITFQVCANASCTNVVASTAAAGVANGSAASWSPSLADRAYYWRARAEDAFGNQSAWSSTTAFVVDTTPPPVPSLLTQDGAHGQTGPVLTARLDTADLDDRPSLVVQVCADPGCANVLTVGYAGGTGTDVGWHGLELPADGVYYWRASAQDGAGNQSGWSGTRSFVVDHLPPDVPALAAPAADALVARPELSGTFHSADATDSGTLSFQVCADAACATVVASGSSAGAGGSGIGRWTAAGLPDGSYFWRARAIDAAGNGSHWSSAQSFTLDATPPGRVREFRAALAGSALTLRWKSPADGTASGGYALFVGDAQTRILDPGALAVTIRVRDGDTRSFSVAAVDTVGNVGPRTRAVVLVPQLVGLTLKEAKEATNDRRFVIRWARSAPGKPLPYVVAQTPAASAIVDEGSSVTVVAGAKPPRPRR